MNPYSEKLKKIRSTIDIMKSDLGEINLVSILFNNSEK